jgi:HAD superfamily hydrolase (TIGR01509 family)
MSKPFIYFDFYDVLATSKRSKDRDTAKILGIKASECHTLIRELTGKEPLFSLWKAIKDYDSELLFFKELAKELCVSAGIAPSPETINRIVDSRLSNACMLKNSVKQTLEKLQQYFFLGMITNARPSRYIHEIVPLRLDKYFPKENIIISSQVGFWKPSKEIFDLAIEKAGVPIRNIVFCDDKPDFLAGAKAAGIEKLILIAETLHKDYFTARKFRDILYYKPIRNYINYEDSRIL